MNTHLLRIATLAVGMLTFQLQGFSQQLVPAPGEVPNNTDTAHPHNYQEIIIRQKTDKDAKVTVEIKDGELFINGKPASEYEDDNLVITKRKLKSLKNGTILDGGDMAISPFRQQWDFKEMMPQNRAFLGVTSMRPDSGPAGARIAEVSPGSAADKAGLKQGDIITRLDEVSIESPEDLSRAVGKYDPNEKATITYLRDGKEAKVTVTLGQSPGARAFGLNGQDEQFFRQIVPRDYNYSWNNPNGSRLGIRAQDTEDGKGAKVIYVDGESAAAKAGIKEQDIITAFDGHPVNDAGSLAAIARESRLKPTVKVNLLRDGKPLELEIKNPRKLRTADL
ncbi:MAG TPA: PDZ domain-containing protein [Puia sp.]|nr:PDZ domain-containing protein [Puia sp.]